MLKKLNLLQTGSNLTWKTLPRTGIPGGPGIALRSRVKRELLQYIQLTIKLDNNTTQNAVQFNPTHSSL